MGYKIGQRVRLLDKKSLERILTEEYVDEFGCYYNSEMRNELAGKVYTIRNISKDAYGIGRHSYRFKECGWVWTECAFAIGKKGTKLPSRYIDAYRIYQSMMEDGFRASSYIAHFFPYIMSNGSACGYRVPDDCPPDDAKIIIAFKNYLIRDFVSVDFNGADREWFEYLIL